VGSVYSRKATKFLWIKYLQHGRVIRESTQTDNIVKARRILRDREGDVEKGVPISPDVGRITFDDAAVDLLNDYSINRKKTYDDTRRRIRKHLSPFFGNRRMITITTTELRAYVTKRLADGTPVRKRRGSPAKDEASASDAPKRPVSAGEINRELTVLKRMFSLAIQAGKLVHKPHFPMLRENNVRAGFFERELYLAVQRHLPTSMRPVVTFAYVTGWRINSEVLPLQWRQVDLKLGEVRLDPGTTKNLEGRVFYLTSELQELLKAQRKAADRIQRRKGMIVQHVFFHDVPTKAGDVGFWSGHAIAPSGFYHAWCRARIAAGCPGSIPHDFRRTAIRNMVRAGIPERVAMKLSGHKTRSVFDRYNVVSDGDLREASNRLGHSFGHSTALVTGRAKRNPQNP
jgi:integrase